MSFQTAIHIQPAPAVEGDFASANPRAVVLAGPGALVAAAAGAVVGRFAWIDADGRVTNSGDDVPAGFIHREMQAMITEWLGRQSMLIPQGLPVTVHRAGDFWARTGNVAAIGQKVFASNTDGSVRTGDPGEAIAGHTETVWAVDSAGAADELIKISTWG
jgi:hypothetical protein